MGVEFEADVKRADSLYRVWPEDIIIIPELNGRHEHTSVEALAADIAKNGQDTPCVIYKDDDGNPVLSAGHRRYRAVLQLNEQDPNNRRALICRCLPRNTTLADAFKSTVRENHFRKDVSPIDDATNIVILKKRFGMADEDVATIYFPEASTDEERAAALKFVKDREALADLAPEAADAVRGGKLKLTAAKALAKLTKTQQREKIKAAAGDKVKGKDVTPAKKTASKKAAGVDKTLVKLAKNVLSEFNVSDESEYISVDRASLVALHAYLYPPTE